jgi:hypothetical protein
MDSPEAIRVNVIQTAPTVMYDNHVRVTIIARPDQGLRYTLLEVPGLTCPGRGSNPGLPRGKRAL